MLLLDFFGNELALWDVGLLSTDISNQALDTAKAGVYPDDRVVHVPPKMKHRYFTKRPDGMWAIHQKVKERVLFRRLNLMRERFPFKRKFQMIFCRNVMIYFDGPTRETLVRHFFEFTEPGGYLFIGHSETLGRTNCPYQYISPAVYRKE